MRSILLFLIVLTGCNYVDDKKDQETIADTSAAKNSYNIEADKKDTIALKQKLQAKKVEVVNEEPISKDFIQRAVISKSDSTVNVYQNIRADYRIFGYKSPDTNSKKLLLFSVFTNDVEGNPHNCAYGSYYYSGAMDNMRLKFVKKVGDFVEVALLKDNQSVSPMFLHHKWVEFDD
ncbi:MAG: hypothetical protein EOO87_03320 [Pedobacter sp.]|nr:MAG: hypothetical protein EOO87_03320 [Pedobacter sp.]